MKKASGAEEMIFLWSKSKDCTCRNGWPRQVFDEQHRQGSLFHESRCAIADGRMSEIDLEAALRAARERPWSTNMETAERDCAVPARGAERWPMPRGNWRRA